MRKKHDPTSIVHRHGSPSPPDKFQAYQYIYGAYHHLRYAQPCHIDRHRQRWTSVPAPAYHHHHGFVPAKGCDGFIMGSLMRALWSLDVTLATLCSLISKCYTPNMSLATAKMSPVDSCPLRKRLLSLPKIGRVPII